MTDESRMVSSSKKVAAGVAGAVVLALGLAGFTVQRTADARWEELQAWMTRVEAQWGARDSRRPVLWGEAAAGNAFEHYDRALQLAAALRDDDHLLRELWNHPEQLTVEEAAELRQRWAPAVTAMRAGAHCEDAREAVDFAAGFDSEITNLLDARWITNMAMIQARDALAAGQGRRAVEITLDAQTFGADLLRSPLLIEQMIAVAILVIGVDEWTDERLRQLEPDALELLADGTRRVDESLPESLPFDGEALFAAHTLTAAASMEGEDSYGSLAAWNYGFSVRWMYADAILTVADVYEAVSRTAALPWPQRELRIDALTEQAARSGNAVVAACVPNLSSAERGLYLASSRVRMLRIAVDLQLGRTPAPLLDPLGDGPLQVIEADDGFEIRGATKELRQVTKPAMDRIHHR